MKHARIEIKFYNRDTFKKQIDVNFIDLDSELMDLNYKVASLIFCHFWRSILPKSAIHVSMEVTSLYEKKPQREGTTTVCLDTKNFTKEILQSLPGF